MTSLDAIILSSPPGKSLTTEKVQVFSSGTPSLMNMVHGKLNLSVKETILMSVFLRERSTFFYAVASGACLPLCTSSLQLKGCFA